MNGSSVGSGVSLVSSAFREGVVDIKRAAGRRLLGASRIARVHCGRGALSKPSATDHMDRESSPRTMAAAMVAMNRRG